MGAIIKSNGLAMISYYRLVLISACYIQTCFCVGTLTLSSSSLGNLPEIRSAEVKNQRTEEPLNEEILYSHRLPKSVIPEKYFLTITPILDEGFEGSLGAQWFAPGEVVISARAAKHTRAVTLHAKNITIHNVTVSHESGNIPVQNVTYNNKYSFVTLSLPGPLIPGDLYELKIHFTSYVSEGLNGLFRSSYKNEETGKQEWFAATHMEALHARQMFPCFDEPSLKAPIQAKIGRKEDYVALFNTESIGNETMQGVEGWIWETFAPTVPMSTYLTALVIAKFRFANAAGNLLPDTRVRTYAPPHYVEMGSAQYSADAAEKILHTYGEYFKEKYPMKKFDSVAVPAFLYGAMENYGLSIFRETLLLHFANESTESQRYVVTNVICHELGHQWFGNLVSPDWWTQLWLSEGLTKFTEYIGLNATVPEFKPWDIFVSESLQLGLRLDGDQRTSHSLRIDDDIWLMKNEMDWFDDIAYKKGGSLIRMMQGFLSEPVLRKGLSRYLSRMKYKAAIQDDLFSDCDKEGQIAHKLPVNTTLKEIMYGWTVQSGFPLLNVTHTPGTTQIKVTQDKYFASRANREAFAGRKPKWFIPVSVATTRNPNFDPEPEFWIRDNETTVRITLPTNSWIILNAGTTGFYRVIYDEELTQRITDQLMEFPLKIDRLARSQLMDDYLNAAWNRYIPITRALNLTRYMKDHPETEHVVWTALLSLLKVAFRLFKESQEDFDIFKGYMLPRIEKGIEATGGFDAIRMNSTGLPVIRQAQLLDWACNLESPGCVSYATNLIKSWKSTGVLEVPRDLRGVVFPAAISNDNTGTLFDFMMDKYKETSTQDDRISLKLKEQLLTALANTKDKNKISFLLDLIFEKGSMKSDSDALTLLQNLASNSYASDIMLQYFVDNFSKVTKRFDSSSPLVEASKTMAPHLKSLNGLFLIEQLVQGNGGSLKAEFSPVINRIRANIIWYDEFGEEMLDFFRRNM